MKLRVCLFCFCCFQYTFTGSKTTKTFTEIKNVVYFVPNFQERRLTDQLILVENPPKIVEISKNVKSTPLEVFLNCLNFLIPARQSKWSRFAGGSLDQENPPQEPGMRLLIVATTVALFQQHCPGSHSHSITKMLSLQICNGTRQRCWNNVTRDYKWGVVPSDVPLLLGAPPPHFVSLTVATLLHRTNKLFKNSNSEIYQKNTKFCKLIRQILVRCQLDGLLHTLAPTRSSYTSPDKRQ